MLGFSTIPSVAGATCLTSATGVLIQDLFGAGTPTTILMIIVLILGILVLFSAFMGKSYNMTNQLIDDGQRLVRKCYSKKTGERKPLLPDHSSVQVKELPPE